ncbi:MAG: hypothetical protein ACC640_01495 [bacterium]
MKAVFFLGPLSYGNEEITVFASPRTLDAENVPLSKIHSQIVRSSL